MMRRCVASGQTGQGALRLLVDRVRVACDAGRVLVLLVRHGHAVDEEPQLPDESRYLSKKGRKAIRELGRVLQKEGIALDAVLTSPLVRATQTAELLAERLDYVGIIEALPCLAPGIPPRIAAQEIPQRGAVVAVVGHEPGLSMLGAFLCGKPAFPPLRKGQVSVLRNGQPLWFIHPETLSKEILLVA